MTRNPAQHTMLRDKSWSVSSSARLVDIVWVLFQFQPYTFTQFPWSAESWNAKTVATMTIMRIKKQFNLMFWRGLYSRNKTRHNTSASEVLNSRRNRENFQAAGMTLRTFLHVDEGGRDDDGEVAEGDDGGDRARSWKNVDSKTRKQFSAFTSRKGAMVRWWWRAEGWLLL